MVAGKMAAMVDVPFLGFSPEDIFVVDLLWKRRISMMKRTIARCANQSGKTGDTAGKPKEKAIKTKKKMHRESGKLCTRTWTSRPPKRSALLNATLTLKKKLLKKPKRKKKSVFKKPAPPEMVLNEPPKKPKKPIDLSPERLRRLVCRKYPINYKIPGRDPPP